jgi:hypothetical protein
LEVNDTNGTPGVSIKASNTGNSDLLFSDVNENGRGRIRYDHGEDALKINVNNHDALLIDSSGNFGIGTTTPSVKLDVNGAARIGDGEYSGLLQLGNTANYKLEVTGNSTVNTLKFEADGAGIRQFAFIDGNLGIGTTNPKYKLDVIGDIRATGSVYYGGTEGSQNGTAYAKPDFVFKENYKALGIEEIDKFIKEHQHLPWLTSEKDEKPGTVNLTRMSFENVEATENLQLQIIALNHIISEQQKQINELKKMLEKE